MYYLPTDGLEPGYDIDGGHDGWRNLGVIMLS